MKIGNKNQFQKYNTSSLSFQNSNINFNCPYAVRKFEPQNNQVENQTKCFQKKNCYQKIQE
jgi:hypothetical protein